MGSRLWNNQIRKLNQNTKMRILVQVIQSAKNEETRMIPQHQRVEITVKDIKQLAEQKAIECSESPDNFRFQATRVEISDIEISEGIQ